MSIEEIFDAARKRAKELQEPNLDKWMDEVRGYLRIGRHLGKTVNQEEPDTVRAAQRALQIMEARLDRILALHHDAKRVLQIIAAVEYQLVGIMTRHEMLPAKATGPAQHQALCTAVPILMKVKTEWETLEQICIMAQKRISSAQNSLKLQCSLDDNLRWAQFRQPG